MFVEQATGLRNHTARGEWEEVGLLVSSQHLPGFFILAAQLPAGLEPQLRLAWFSLSFLGAGLCLPSQLLLEAPPSMNKLLDLMAGSFRVLSYIKLFLNTSLGKG